MAGYCDPPKEHRFKKGQSGNPKGAKPGVKTTKTIIKEFFKVLDKFDNPFTGKQERMSIQQAIILKQMYQAYSKGDTRAFDALHDRLEGRPKQTIETEGLTTDIKTINIIPASKVAKVMQNGQNGH